MPDLLTDEELTLAYRGGRDRTAWGDGADENMERVRAIARAALDGGRTDA